MAKLFHGSLASSLIVARQTTSQIYKLLAVLGSDSKNTLDVDISIWYKQKGKKVELIAVSDTIEVRVVK